MGILFLKGGLFTTVQDIGRNGYQKSGFHVSGVMDKRSFMLANLLVDNPENEAVLEFTMIGPTLKFTSDTIIAITGGDFSPKMNGKEVPMYTAVYAHKNDILEFQYAKEGNWGYVAFSSRLDIPMVMGSRSTDTKCRIGGYHGRKLEKGDQIWFRAKRRYLPSFLSRSIPQEHFEDPLVKIRVVMGPQDDYFTAEGIRTFLNEEYTVTSDCDRMGYRLDGAYIAHNDKGADIISDGIAHGSIQVPSNGRPIVMLSDRQTTGGYTKIATIISVDIPKLVQCKEQTRIRFETISVEKAQKLYLEELETYDVIRQKIHHPCREVLDPRQSAKRIATLFKD